MNELDEILTITGFFESKFKEKGSQFIGLAYPINSEEEFSSILASFSESLFFLIKCENIIGGTV